MAALAVGFLLGALNGGVGLAAGVALFALLYPWFRPWPVVRRAIVLDAAKNELNVYGNGKLEVSQPLDKIYTFTLDKHPLAEAEEMRNRRADKIGEFQKQQCLFGLFGPGGAYKVKLVCRYEWPCVDSLYEVRQALIWAIQALAGPEEGERAARGAGGMRPPLD
jgi:hypothetical protein